MHDGREVANYVLDYCHSKGRRISNLPLQKIVYFCHVWSLIKLGKPLIKHKFEAWEYGPVLQYLYHEFKVFEAAPITARAMRINSKTGKKEEAVARFDEETRKFLEEPVEFYSRMDAGSLVELSHAKGGPWDKVWNHAGKVNPGMQIDDAEIVRYYSSLKHS